MKMKPIETEEEYEVALQHLDELMSMNLVPYSEEEKLLEELATLIVKYEEEHYPIG